jgi:hypothetical protein
MGLLPASVGGIAVPCSLLQQQPRNFIGCSLHARQYSTLSLNLNWKGSATTLLARADAMNVQVPRRHKSRPKQPKTKKADKDEQVIYFFSKYSMLPFP